MKKKFTPHALVILLSSLLFACAVPKSIIKLQPEQENGRWLYGQNFVADSLYGVVYETGFDRVENNRYCFDFNIINRSNMPILVDPATFWIQPFDSLGNMIYTRKKLPAIDPEDEILEMEKQLSRNEAAQKNELGIALVAVGVGVATAIALDNNDNPNDDGRVPLFYDVEGEHIDNQIEAQSMNDVMEDWKNTTLRKTTLNSNYSIQGRVFFPAFPDAHHVTLYLPVDDEYVEINFIQKQISARRQ